MLEGSLVNRLDNEHVRRNAFVLLVVVATLAVGCAEPFASTLPTVPVVAANAADISYSCGGRPAFSPALFDKPGDAEKLQTPVGAAFRDFLAKPAAEGNLSGWYYLGGDAETATFILPRVAEDDVIVADVQNDGGRWYAPGFENCGAEAVLEGLQNADWIFDPASALPQSTDRQFVALVTHDTCMSGQASSTATVTSPAIRYEQDRILVIFGQLMPLDEPAICEANRGRTARVLVHLDEPIGIRRLLDGGRYPPGDPTKPD
jgi:hypothetical protein